MGIKLEVELMMPTMPSSFRIKHKSKRLENAHDHMQVGVADLDEAAVEKVCQQWSAEFRAHASRLRVVHPGLPKVSNYFGPDLEDDE